MIDGSRTKPKDFATLSIEEQLVDDSKAIVPSVIIQRLRVNDLIKKKKDKSRSCCYLGERRARTSRGGTILTDIAFSRSFHERGE